jgi:polysaccharide export outer membrane protein
MTGRFPQTVLVRYSWLSAETWLRWLRSRLAALLLALPLAACATATANLPPLTQAPAPQAGLIAALPAYRVQIGDVLDVKLFLNPELNDEVTVRPDGMISTALAQDIPAYGHTPTEISQELKNAYTTNLKDPQISVIVHSFAPNRIYVAGEVANPGEFVTVGPNLTISQAIARAGGVKLGGDRDRIFVLRRGPNDTPHAFSVDFKGIISARRPASDVRLAQYDVIYVPRTGVYETYTYWNQFLQQFVPVNWGFSYNLNPIVSSKQ